MYHYISPTSQDIKAPPASSRLQRFCIELIGSGVSRLNVNICDRDCHETVSGHDPQLTLDARGRRADTESRFNALQHSQAKPAHEMCAAGGVRTFLTDFYLVWRGHPRSTRQRCTAQLTDEIAKSVTGRKTHVISGFFIGLSRHAPTHTHTALCGTGEPGVGADRAAVTPCRERERERCTKPIPKSIPLP